MQGTPPERDWTYEVTDKIESVVSVVRDRTTKPVVAAATSIIYAVIAIVLVAFVMTMLVLAVYRILDVYLPITPESRKVWVVDMLTGAIALAAGLFLLRVAKPRVTESKG
jgi:hypothetical protein